MVFDLFNALNTVKEIQSVGQSLLSLSGQYKQWSRLDMKEIRDMNGECDK